MIKTVRKWKAKDCTVCGKSFHPIGPHQNYCSMMCRFQTLPFHKTCADSCWVWCGAKFPKGYGHMRYNGKLYVSHHFAWECFHGFRPKGLCVCHSCHNPSCINPAHLYLATQQKNTDDARVISRLAKKLTPTDVIAIRKLLGQRISYRKVAKVFGVTQNSIGRINRGQAWTHI